MSETRYRCQACGNLTRFDVTVARRTRAFHHYTVGGDLEIEDTEVLSEELESVVCRWCGPSATVEELGDGDLPAVDEGTVTADGGSAVGS